MLPPPTTTATWTPRSRTSTSCLATPSILPKSSPNPTLVSAKASPDSLTTTRSNRGLPSPSTGPGWSPGSSPTITYAMGSLLRLPGAVRPIGPWTGLGAFPDLEPREATQHQLLADLGRVVVEQVLDGLLVVADVGLFEQDDLLVVVLELAVDDLLDDVVRLALRLAGVDLTLAVGHVVGHVVARHVPRVGHGDVQGDLMGQALELVGLGHEVGLAVELDQHAELGWQVRVGRVQVGVDDALGGAAPGPLLHAGLAALAQQLGGLVQVAARLPQRVPAVHHSGPGGVPEGLDLSGRDLHVGWCSLLRCRLDIRCPSVGVPDDPHTRGDRLSLVGSAASSAASAGVSSGWASALDSVSVEASADASAWVEDSGWVAVSGWADASASTSVEGSGWDSASGWADAWASGWVEASAGASLPASGWVEASAGASPPASGWVEVALSAPAAGALASSGAGVLAVPDLPEVALRAPERLWVELRPPPAAWAPLPPLPAGFSAAAAVSPSAARPKRPASAWTPLSDSSSSRSHSASGSSSAGLAAIAASPSLPATSDAYTLRSRSPSATASATIRVSRLPARMASSLPGIG